MTGRGTATSGEKRITRNAMSQGSQRSPKTPLTPDNGDSRGAGGNKPKGPDIQKVLDRLDTIEVSLQTKIEASIQSQEFSAKQLSDKIEKVEVANDKVHQKCDTADEERAGIRAQLKVQGTRLQEIEEKIEQIEREKRRNILVIEGVQEKEGEKVMEIVNKIFGDLNLGFGAEICTGIYRRGRNPSDNRENNKEGAAERVDPIRRPLVIIFPSVAEKAAVFRNLKNLNGKEEGRRVFFNDDLTETQASEQRDLRALAAFAKARGYEARARAGLLELERMRYRYHELN